MLGLMLECLRSSAKILSEVPCVSMFALIFMPPALSHSGMSSLWSPLNFFLLFRAALVSQSYFTVSELLQSLIYVPASQECSSSSELLQSLRDASVPQTCHSSQSCFRF